MLGAFAELKKTDGGTASMDDEDDDDEDDDDPKAILQVLARYFFFFIFFLLLLFFLVVSVSVLVSVPFACLLWQVNTNLISATELFENDPMKFLQENPLCSETGLQLAKEMLALNRWKRISAREALGHEYFYD